MISNNIYVYIYIILYYFILILYIYIYIYTHRVRRENFDTAHRKIDGIEMKIKVPYRLAIFAIIEILIFEIVLMRTRREKSSSRSR